MEEIRCSECGHLNPITRTTCERCGTRLVLWQEQEPEGFSGPEEPTGVEVSAAEPPVDEELQAWLREVLGDEPLAPMSVESTVQEERGFQKDAIEGAEAVPGAAVGGEPGAEGDAEEKLPPWLVEPVGEPEAEGPGAARGEPGAKGGAEEELPPWLVEPVGEPEAGPHAPSVMTEGEAVGPTVPEELSQSPGIQEDEVPVSGPSEPAQEETFTGLVVDEAELSALLEQLPGPEEAPSTTAEEGDLEEGQLPEWLRPPEDPVLADLDLTSPLAGIPDVLPLETRLADLAQQEKVQPILRLLVRPEERRWARWLTRLLQNEDRGADEAEEESQTFPYHWWRLGVGLALLMLLALFVALGSDRSVGSPQPSKGALAFVQLAQTVPEGAVIPLVVDVQPAWAPELALSALTALRLLEPSRPHYLLVSTQPYGQGPALDLMQQAQVPPERYTWAGYLPGQLMAMALLARWPRATLGQLAPEVWNQPPLATWRGLQGSPLLLVWSDQFSQTRGWIEQLTLHAETVPPLAVLTTWQMEPVLEPYFDHQVQAWIAGSMDAAALAGQTQVTIPQRLWRSWAVSGPLGLVLGLVSWFSMALWQRQRASQGG